MVVTEWFLGYDFHKLVCLRGERISFGFGFEVEILFAFVGDCNPASFCSEGRVGHLFSALAGAKLLVAEKVGRVSS